MLLKLLLFVLVVIVAWRMVLQQRNRPQSLSTQAVEPGFSFSRWLPILAGLLLLAAGLFGGWRIYAGYQVLQVTIVTSADGSREHYQVRRKDISADQLVTIDGVVIRLSTLERLEIGDN